MNETRHEISKKELLDLLKDCKCDINKKRKYLMIDYIGKTKETKYLNDYISVINSLSNIHKIWLYMHCTEDYHIPKKFEIDIFMMLIIVRQMNLKNNILGN